MKASSKIPAEAPRLEVVDLQFSIGDFALDVSFSAPGGKYFVLAGPNGCGKTVLMKLLAGVYRPESGSISLGGRDITNQPPWKRNLGYVPQTPSLFPNRTVRGNLDFALEVRGQKPRARRAEVERIAELLQVTHLLPRRAVGLSGGEAQRISIARALVFSPAILLLDEPVSAIEETQRDKLCVELKSLQRRLGTTVVHVSHNSRETQLLADCIGQFGPDGQITIQNPESRTKSPESSP